MPFDGTDFKGYKAVQTIDLLPNMTENMVELRKRHQLAEYFTDLIGNGHYPD